MRETGKDAAHLGTKNVVHRQDINFRKDSKWRLDLGSHNLGTSDRVASWVGDPLESHITSSAVGANINISIVDDEEAILQSRANKAVSLTVPTEYQYLASQVNKYT